MTSNQQESKMTTLTIEQALALASILNTPKVEASAPNMVQGNSRKVIVRSRDAGVQYGELVGYEGSTVHLKNARQMWSWTAAEGGTLLDCATHGVKAGKFSTVASAITVIGACAIIDVSEKAVASLEAAKWA
jgi:hypothetical protein